MAAAQLDPIQLKADLDEILPFAATELNKPDLGFLGVPPTVVAALQRQVAWLQSVADDPVALPALASAYNSIVATKPSP
jgi:hypothetical protein